MGAGPRQADPPPGGGQGTRRRGGTAAGADVVGAGDGGVQHLAGGIERLDPDLGIDRHLEAVADGIADGADVDRAPLGPVGRPHRGHRPIAEPVDDAGGLDPLVADPAEHARPHRRHSLPLPLVDDESPFASVTLTLSVRSRPWPVVPTRTVHSLPSGVRPVATAVESRLPSSKSPALVRDASSSSSSPSSDVRPSATCFASDSVSPDVVSRTSRPGSSNQLSTSVGGDGSSPPTEPRMAS